MLWRILPFVFGQTMKLWRSCPCLLAELFFFNTWHHLADGQIKQWKQLLLDDAAPHALLSAPDTGLQSESRGHTVHHSHDAVGRLDQQHGATAARPADCSSNTHRRGSRDADRGSDGGSHRDADSVLHQQLHRLGPQLLTNSLNVFMRPFLVVCDFFQT